MTSRISKFYKKTPKERLEIIAEQVDLSEAEKDMLLGEKSLSLKHADRMVENAIGYFHVPLGIAVNFKINGKELFIPMATEEPSVIAAASNAAKQTSEGFFTSYTGSLMRGQIQINGLNDPYGAMTRLYENKQQILETCNKQDPTLVSLGGGAKDIEVHIVDMYDEKAVVTHILVDTKDAMGANAVNSMAEAVGPLIEKITGGKVILRILSNLADHRIVRARAVFDRPFAQNKEALNNFIKAYKLAEFDPYRAATHNKGIMNGITAVVLATGNDTRAVEAGAHAYAAKSGGYRSLSKWEVVDESLVGTIEIPMAVGLIGGATSSHPIAKLTMKILDVHSAEELAGVIASVGLAQNFAALYALSNEGIQKGHMKLHARNLAAMAGAKDEEIDEVVKLALKQGKTSYDQIKQIVETVQESNSINQ